jgi:hypothetical protein
LPENEVANKHYIITHPIIYNSCNIATLPIGTRSVGYHRSIYLVSPFFMVGDI